MMSIEEKIAEEAVDALIKSRNKIKTQLDEAIEIIKECEKFWGCECPYCDRDFGDDFMDHDEDCRVKKFLDRVGDEKETKDI